MRFRKQKTHELDPAIQINNADEVLETISSLNIPKSKLIIIGSSALSLYMLDRHAHDVDAILHPDLLQELDETGTLPNGIRVANISTQPGFSRFQADTSPLPSDFIPHKSALGNESFEDVFRRAIISPDGIPLQSPADLWRNKYGPVVIANTQEERLKKLAQNAYDLNLLDKYMKDTRR